MATIIEEYVSAFPLAGIFGVGRLATKLNLLLKDGRIGPWHIGPWTDFKHTEIQIKFLSAADRQVARNACAAL